MIINIIKNNYFKLFLIIIFSLIIDNLFLLNINKIPAWDQGYHLSNVFKMFNIIEDSNTDIIQKISELLDVTNSYRGPLTYFLSALFLKVFNNSYKLSYLSNQIFNVICIFSIFNLGKLLKNQSIGIWASIVFTFSTIIVSLRTDYLIDLSLTAFSTINLLFLTRWYLDKSNISKFSILSGISFGLIFLTKPTGIIFFVLPFLFLILKKIKDRKSYIYSLDEILLFLLFFILLIFPWFSRHWLTIITSTINAWNWGINYQDGLEANSIKSWLFYFKELPSAFGIINFSIFIIIFLIEIFSLKNLFKGGLENISKIHPWFFIYLLNSYLILSLMSTKDIRFILPIFPLFCIYLSIFINSTKGRFFSIANKRAILIISISISLFLSNDGIILKNLKHNKLNKWPHSEVISQIKESNSNLTATLAILPDTKEINTFTLEAEAAKQGEYVAVRQIISNKETYKEDLKYFDWFLLKTADQGIMTNESKNLLNKYLLNNKSFVIDKEWKLPDDSDLILLRRKSLNTYLSKEDCLSNSPILKIKQIDNGININLSGEGNSIKSSSLLIDFRNKGLKSYSNISLANGSFHNSFDEESCYVLSQDVSINFDESLLGSLTFKARLLDKNGTLKTLNTYNKNLNIEAQLANTEYIPLSNRISKVELMGIYLRKGEFKNLFNLVGIINQSDPKQIYLKDAEKIFMQRYKESKEIKNLYSILISQVLQKKVINAEKTINLILESDKENGNLFLAKSIINIYLLDRKDARLSLNKAKSIEKSLESEEVLKIVEGLTYLLEMKFVNAYKTFI